MKIIGRALLLSSLYYLIALVISGCCNCPASTMELQYRWTGVKLYPGSYVADSTTLTVVEDSLTRLAGKNLMLRLRWDYELVAHRGARVSLFSEAYACKCADEIYRAQHKLTGIRVVTIKSFDAAHPAGSDVSEYFKAASYDPSRTFLGFVSPDAQLSDLQKDGYAVLNDFRIYLIQSPAPGSLQQFQVIGTLDDGSSFADQTAVLQF